MVLEDHAIHVVIVIAYTDMHLLNLDVVWNRMRILQWNSISKLGRGCSIVKGKSQRCYSVYGGPLYIGDPELAQEGMLLKYLQIGVLQGLQIWPLGLSGNRLVVNIRPKVFKVSSQFFDSLVKVKLQVQSH